MSKKTKDKILCQGCLSSIPEDEIYIVRKSNHSFFACEKCAKNEYSDFESVLYSLNLKANSKTESYVKNGVTKDNKKVKVGETYNGILITGIKKIKTTGNIIDNNISEKISYYITGNKKDWVEI